MNVACRNCSYSHVNEYGTKFCLHPSNVYFTSDEYNGKKPVTLKQQFILNRDNDCKMFKKISSITRLLRDFDGMWPYRLYDKYKNNGGN